MSDIVVSLEGVCMNGLSRRKFLAASGASAIAVGVVTVPMSMSANDQADGVVFDQANLESEPLILSVDDLKAGRISVMHGEREFSVTDLDLAGRIAALLKTGA